MGCPHHNRWGSYEPFGPDTCQDCGAEIETEMSSRRKQRVSIPPTDLEKRLGLDKTTPEVDRGQQTLTDGSAITPSHRELRPNGQQKGYVVLSEEERAKGFVRPVRRSYVHDTCGGVTTMGNALAETYARDPEFYSGTFCATCGSHFPTGPLGQFRWLDDGSKVGT